MSRLPVVGSDTDDWGTVLNDYLSVSHNADGTFKPSVVRRPYHYLVAAADCNPLWRAMADYVCDGTADDVEINAALAQAAIFGGVVELSDTFSYFNCAGTLTVAPFVRLIGQGEGMSQLRWTTDLGAGVHAVILQSNAALYSGRAEYLSLHTTGTITRGVKPMNMDGFRVDAGAALHEVGASGFNRGIRITGDHSKFTRVFSGNNYWNLEYADLPTTMGNHSFVQCDFSGPTYGSVHVTGGNVSGGDTFEQVHFGFGPHCWVKDDHDDGSVASLPTMISGTKFIGCFWEHFGNSGMWDRTTAPASSLTLDGVTFDECGVIHDYGDNGYVSDARDYSFKLKSVRNTRMNLGTSWTADGPATPPGPTTGAFKLAGDAVGWELYGGESWLESFSPIPMFGDANAVFPTFGRMKFIVPGEAEHWVANAGGTISAGDLVMRGNQDQVIRNDGTKAIAGIAQTSAVATQAVVVAYSGFIYNVNIDGTAPGINTNLTVSGTTPYHLQIASARDPVIASFLGSGHYCLNQPVPSASLVLSTGRAAQTTSGAVTLNTAAANFHPITLNGNMTACTLSNPPATTTDEELTIAFIQDGTGSRTVVPPTNIKWAGGAAPTWSTTANWRDIIKIGGYDGTNWFERSRSLAVR